jgi:hypothetical protein
MPRTPRDTTTPTRRRRSTTTATGPIVGQISQLVSSNEKLAAARSEGDGSFGTVED